MTCHSSFSCENPCKSGLHGCAKKHNVKFSTLCSPSSSVKDLPSSSKGVAFKAHHLLVDCCLLLNRKKKSSPYGPCFFGTFQTLAVVHSPTAHESPPSHTFCRLFVSGALTVITEDRRSSDKKRNANPNFYIHKQLPNTLTPSPGLPPDFSGS